MKARTIGNKLLLLSYFPILAAMLASVIGMFYWLTQSKGIVGWPYLFSNTPAPHPLFMTTFLGELTFAFVYGFSRIDRKLKENREKESP